MDDDFLHQLIDAAYLAAMESPAAANALEGHFCLLSKYRLGDPLGGPPSEAGAFPIAVAWLDE